MNLGDDLPHHQRWARPPRTVLTGCDVDAIHDLVQQSPLPIVGPDEDPELALTYGGDGSLLGADRDFPTLPKAVIRRQDRYDFCPIHEPKAMLNRLASGLVTSIKLPRLQADLKGQSFQALNDVVFHNARATSAVRYRIKIDGRPYTNEIIGDGLIVATPFGSSAYFRSITRCVFRVGIGLAFNNSTESVHHLILDCSSSIEIEVTRGPGIVFGDNMREHIPVEEGDVFTIRCTSDFAEIIEFDSLTCRDCQELSTGKPAGHRHM